MTDRSKRRVRRPAPRERERCGRAWRDRFARLGTVCATLCLMAIPPGVSSVGSETGSPVATRADADAGPRPRITPALHPRSSYFWPYATGPFYGRPPLRAPHEPGRLVTAVGTFRLDGKPLPFPTELTAGDGLDGRSHGYFLVQIGPDTVSRRGWAPLDETLRTHGGEILRHLPVATVLARLTPESLAALARAEGLLAIEPYHPAFKLDPAIGRTPLNDPDRAISTVYVLDVLLHRGEDPRASSDNILALGGAIRQVFADRLQVELPAARLADLARFDAVDRVHEAVPLVPWDQQITNAIQTGGIRFNRNPYHEAGIRGGGQVLMVLDDGIQLDAGDLSDTSTSPGTPGSGHRKVRFYGTTVPFGGGGDDAGCDAAAQGGFTHGHLVAAVALGNPEHTGLTFRTTDRDGRSWDLTGVAPDATLVAYDAAMTPAVGGCRDTLLGGLTVGDLYGALGAPGSLDDAHGTHGARVFNLSWGSALNSYGIHATDVDGFLDENPEALVVVAAGNLGADIDGDGRADPGSVGEPATAKNALTVGASGGPDDHHDPGRVGERAGFSSVGPAGSTDRVAPLLMAPGQERGATGPDIAFACRSADNDNTGAVLCDTASGHAGTSYAAAGASGAALLVRDYFAQGFHPDGTSANPGNAAEEATASGALVKSVLIASAVFLEGDPGSAAGRDGLVGIAAGGPEAGGDGHNLSVRNRFNDEQGYGRIQLDRVLPLQSWAASPTGLVIVDGGIPGGVNDLGGALTGTIDATTPTTQGATFEVCDDRQELRIALSWIEAPGDALLNDLDLALVAPDGTLYFGNYFTDDDDGDGSAHPLLEDCPSRFDDGTPHDGGLDRSAWSLATCTRPGEGAIPPSLPPRDSVNPTEAIFLSPNPEGRFGADGEPLLRDGQCDDAGADPCGYDGHCNGVACVGGTSQVQTGTWTVSVSTKGPGIDPAQGYALVIGGGVCLGSSVTVDAPTYACSAAATLTINERDEPGDPAVALTDAEVASRTTVEVVAPGGGVVDTEAGSALGLALEDPGSLQFVARDVVLTDSTVYEPGNGVLDVGHGDSVRVRYADESSGVPDPDKLRETTAEVDCRVRALSGLARFAQFGRDTGYFVVGGCERNARGLFEFGFPDRYLDAGELIGYRFAFVSVEPEPLLDVEAVLLCVEADADSPADCEPGSTDCADPERANNTPCSDLTILEPRQTVPRLEANAVMALEYPIRLGAISGTPEVELLLSLAAPASGKTTPTLLVHRHRLNVDETSVHYSTDFPQGGTLLLDRDNNGLIETPLTTGISGAPTSNNTDYRFETVVYADLTSGVDAMGNAVAVNSGLQAPWNFDPTDGGFTTGLAAGSDDGLIADVIAQWGEDTNFNNMLDGHCQSRPGVICNRFPLDPISCGGCDAASTNPGTPCNFNGECPGGTCDFTCLHDEERDPVNSPFPLLDQNWSTAGGCGWQTRAPATCAGDATVGCYGDADCGAFAPCNGPAQATGGIWHTGRIGATSETPCSVAGNGSGQCQVFETIGGTSGSLARLELLLTPVLTKVNRELDATGQPLATAEIVDWRWNQTVDLPDENAAYTVEFDNDLDALEPTDLTSDMTVLTTAAGPYGALSGAGNPSLTRGWSLFAPLDPATGNSTNGSNGKNRTGKNGCAFEGGAVPPGHLDRVFTGLPPDDDVNEGYCPDRSGRGGVDPHLNYCTLVCSQNTAVACATGAACAGTCVGGVGGFCSNDPSTGCSTNQDCDFGNCVDVLCNGECTVPGTASCSNGVPGICNTDAECAAACVFTSATVDEFVTPEGPVRGHQLSDWNGPDMRFETLADLIGPAGDRFRGAIGLLNREAAGGQPAIGGYGLGIDDMVVEWREFTLDPDTTDCVVSGACATIGFSATHLYETRTVVGITVLDPTPSNNDCDLDGSIDVPADVDCDDDGTRDVVIRVDSPSEPAGERVVLNAADAAQQHFQGTIAVSPSYDVPGTLHVTATDGAAATVRATYVDRDDGTGNPCPGSVDPALDGLVQATATVFVRPAALVVTGHTLTDNGDDDGWADTGETVELTVEVANKGPDDLNGVLMWLRSSSPAIGCVTTTGVTLGDLASGETRLAPAAFRFVVGSGVQRNSLLEELSATFQVDFTAEGYEGALAAQEIVLDLDLDATGGGTPKTFFEGFESGFGQFTTMHLDEDLNPPASDLANRSAGLRNADGYRCAYTDPAWEHNATFGTGQGQSCFPNPDGAADAFWFDVVTDRAYSGAQSIGFNVFLDAVRGYTTPTAQLEAIRTIDPIQLGYASVCSETRSIRCATTADCPPGETCDDARPTLSFKHQISLLDDRSVNAGAGRTADRGVVAVQLADGGGLPAGPWIKVHPITNVYDARASSEFFNCSFDPTDDGNGEDDFFDPTDPARSLGPSSTCAPGFVFARQGATSGPFDGARIGRASDGPGLAGALGDGTWVEPRFDLSRFRGRSLRLRFLASSLKLDDAASWEEVFRLNPHPGDDGWFIDDVTLTDAIETATATLSPDVKDNAALPDCAAIFCGQAGGVVALLQTSTATTKAPGQTVELDASSSAVDVCKDGILQYRFWIDKNGDATFQPDLEPLLRDWTDNPILVDAPCSSTEYGLEARCATDTACSDSTSAVVTVDCPSAQPSDCACAVPTGGVSNTFVLEPGHRYWVAPPEDPDPAQGITNATALRTALRSAASDSTLQLHVARHVPYLGTLAYECYPNNSQVFGPGGPLCWWYNNSLSWGPREGIEIRLTNVAMPPVVFTWMGLETPPVVYPQIQGLQLFALPWDSPLTTASGLAGAFGAGNTISVARLLSTSGNVEVYTGSPNTNFALEAGQAYQVQLSSGSQGTLANGSISGVVFTDGDGTGNFTPLDCGIEGLQVSAQHLVLGGPPVTGVSGVGGAFTLSVAPGPYLVSVDHGPIQGGPFSMVTVNVAPGATVAAEVGRAAEPEICNTFDDDCDGIADNATIDSNQQCGMTNVGACSFGLTSCNGGNLVCVGDVDPVPEVCNTLDDDCDGIPDNVLCGVGACVRTGTCNGMNPVCTPGAPGIEICNGVDDNCDGVIDGVRYAPN